MTNEISFQMRMMDSSNICIPFTFELGKRHMFCDWLVDIYR